MPKYREHFVGTWELVAHTHHRGPVDPVPHCSPGASASLAVSKRGSALGLRLEPASGLILRVRDDGTWEDQGAAQLPWIDEEGALCPRVVPLAGTLSTGGKKRAPVALLDTPRGASRRRTGQPVWRVRDGDTSVCDLLEPFEGGLLRTVNVVTDLTALDRLLYRYQRGSASGA